VFLKKLALGLLIANALYFVYHQNWLHQLIHADSSQREPERILKQIYPDAIAIKPIDAAAAPPATPMAAAEVCTAGPREQWLIYMGPYPTRALADKKKNELTQLGVTSSDISRVDLKIGLSLGQFATEALASAELKRLNRKGIKTATILLWATVSDPCATEKL